MFEDKVNSKTLGRKVTESKCFSESTAKFKVHRDKSLFPVFKFVVIDFIRQTAAR